MRKSQGRLSILSLGIIGLTAATAAIHGSRALADPEIRMLFILNSLGYLTLLAALYLPLPAFERHRRLVGRVLMGYTAVTIILFIVWGLMSGDWLAIGLVDKMIEMMLLFLLWQEDRQSDIH